MHRYVKKYMKRFILIFIIVILFVDVISAAVHNNAYAEGLPTSEDEGLPTTEEEAPPTSEEEAPPTTEEEEPPTTGEEEPPATEEENLPTFEILIDQSIRGNITITLQNSEDPTEIQTEEVVDGKVTFNDFVNSSDTYDIQITGMIGYEDYSQLGLTFSDTYLSFELIDFEPLETIEVRGLIVDEGDNPYCDGGTVSYTGYDDGSVNLENDGTFCATVYKDKSYEFTVIPANEKYNNPMYLGIVNGQTDILDLNGKLSIKEFSITTNAGENGTITESEDSIPYGSSRSVSAKADQGYRIETFMIDNSPVTDAVGKVEYDFSFDEINTDHIVEVTFTVKTWEVRFSFSENGKLFQEENEDMLVSGGYIIAKEGDNPSFTAKADNNYHISSVEIDGVVQTDCVYNNDLTEYSYEFTNIDNDHFITITFAINTYDINIITGENGSVLVGDSSAGTTQNINHGENLTLILVPDEEYDVEEITLDGEAVNNFDFIDNNSTYEYVLPVTEAHTITIKFCRIETIDDDLTGYKLMAENLISGYPKIVGGTQVYNFLNGDSRVIITPQLPYTKIRINGERNFISSYSEIEISDSKKISRIEVYNPSKRLGSRWVEINILDIQIIMDKTEPCVVDIPAMEWTNHDYIVNGNVTDEDSETNPSSGLSRVVWSNVQLTKTQVLEEETNTVPISNGTYAFTCTGEHNNERYYVYAVDNANNVSDEKTIDIKIDMTKPEITEFTFGKLESYVDPQNINFLTYGTFFNKTIEVEVSVKDEGVSSGLKEITIYSDGNAVETKPVVGSSAKFDLGTGYFSGNEITASIKDVAGNESEGKTKPSDVVTNANSDKVCIKNEKPIISIEPTSPASNVNEEKKWYNSNVGFDIKVTTESGGIYAIGIKINGQEITTDVNKKKIDANYYVSQTLLETFNVNTDLQPLEGENIIEVTAVNNYGNKQTITEKVYIDTTKPEITEFTFGKLESYVDPQNINFLTFGTFFNKTIEVEVSAKDEGVSSGQKEITIYSDGNAVETKPVVGSSAKFNLGFDYFSGNEITASINDVAGNESEGKTKPSDVVTNANSDKVCIKNEKPIISIVPTSSASYVKEEKQWYNNNVGFDIKVTTESGGIYAIGIKINGQEITTDVKKKKIDANYYESPTLQETFNVNTDFRPLDGENIIEVTAVNNYGNKQTITEKVYIDTTKPKIVGFNIDKLNSDMNSVMLNYLSFGNFFNDKVRITVIADDNNGATSGISTITLYVNGNPVDDLAQTTTVIGEGKSQAVFILPKEIISNSNILKAELTATATDNVKNSSFTTTPSSVNSSIKSNLLVVETINPIIEFSVPQAIYTDKDDKKSYNDDVMINIQAKDVDSGIRSVQISINGTEIQKDMNGKEVNAYFSITETHAEVFQISTSQGIRADDGSYVIEVTVVDNAGNKYMTSETVYKDTDRPNITGINFIPTTSDGISDTSEFIDELEYGFFFKEEFTAVVHVSDKEPSSGLDRIKYHLISYQNGKKTGENSGEVVIVDGIATIAVPKGFKGQIILEALDNTKNSSMEVTSKAFVSDDSNPKISIVINNDTSYTDADGNKLYVSDMSFTVSLTDNLSGIKEIGYSKQSEKETLERKVISINNTGYKVGDDIGDGWVISEMDCNLITKVSKIFKLKSEDNDIVLAFDVTDNCNNKKDNVKTEKITIDKTAPIINVVFRKDVSKSSYYYNANRIADITVLERNFDEDLIKAIIQNTYGNVPNVSFKKESNIKHVAVINFDEGDYTLDVKGKDLGDHSATVSYSGGNEKLFYVDKTKPLTADNFSTFSSSKTNNSFNEDKTISIEVTEHNFDPQLIHLTIKRKTAGSSHTGAGFTDVSDIASISKWISSGDKHKLSFTISEDGVYQVELKTSDLAENSQDTSSTVVFEIDKTVPVVKTRNDNFVASDDTEFLDIYPYSRKDELAPSIEFEDLNLDHLEYVLTTFIPDYTGSEGQTIVQPARTYVEEDKNKTGIIKEAKFTLPNFEKDGVYALEITAVDVAGNKSIVNQSTYARLVDRDVLAYIMDSNLVNKTGLYSFQYENGDAISKRPDDFSDINILVFAKKKSDTQIVLRDNNELEINTDATISTDNSLYGIGIYRYSLQANYFKDNFQNDTDMELHLTVNNEDERVDLGKMHIDNIMPTCEIPIEFKSWNWYYGELDRTITLANISEPIDTDLCKVYDNGKEIPFTYISENNSLEFTLTKGWHSVGVIINDMAGNSTNISEREYMYIGYFWLWFIATLAAIALTAMIIIVSRNIRRKRRIESE
ncbi:Ig-like domain (group 3) [Anaerosporobacter mobilis DSM 15930]|uniref:Ig-like domain (Group 3) n=1 Tax=Anaerosporobacter mobilis DSM 15930 TaxID=1120996 RepID=A0A1M7N2N1_9FIRM|nr:hypothetical protein [Anaerosporobacter mobilis]SHM97760.1 Ig-like domain (group 3) [Anaerosporobacter mobilis DSM 15930]